MNARLKNLILLLLSFNLHSCINKDIECESDEDCINNFILNELNETKYDFIVLSYDSDCEASFYEKMDVINNNFCKNKSALIIHFCNTLNIKYKLNTNCSVKFLNFETAEKYDIYFNMIKVLKKTSINTYTLYDI